MTPKHWIAYMPGDAGAVRQSIVMDERNVQACRDAGHRVEGPFVPAAEGERLRAVIETAQSNLSAEACRQTLRDYLRHRGRVEEAKR